jgi:hypothetical protein
LKEEMDGGGYGGGSEKLFGLVWKEIEGIMCQ